MKEIQRRLQPASAEEKTPGEDRLVLLCDGIFAIAMTLLVLDINVPSGITDPAQLLPALKAMIAPTAIYLMTFLIIASYWRFHRALMQVVQRLDNPFIWLTFIFLAFIAIFPATCKLMGTNGNYRLVVIIYTLGLSGCGLSAFALWVYATAGRRLVSAHLPDHEIQVRGLTLVLNPLIFCASLLLLLWIPDGDAYLLCFSWVAIGFAQRFIRPLIIRWLIQPLQKRLRHPSEEQAGL